MPAPSSEDAVETTLAVGTLALRYGLVLRLLLHDGGLPCVTGAEARWRPLPGRGAGARSTGRRSSGLGLFGCRRWECRRGCLGLASVPIRRFPLV